MDSANIDGYVVPQVEAVEAVLEQERKASNAKDARHKLTVERLRQKLVELQVKQTAALHKHLQEQKILTSKQNMTTQAVLVAAYVFTLRPFYNGCEAVCWYRPLQYAAAPLAGLHGHSL